MKSVVRKHHVPYRLNLPVIERLERRILMSTAAAPVAHAKTPFAVSDIFGAASGIPIWQNGQPVVASSAAPSSTSIVASPTASLPLIESSNGVLVGSATVAGGTSIFSVLPVLPPDSLAALIDGMIDPSRTI
jgi:hypothetical protein